MQTKHIELSERTVMETLNSPRATKETGNLSLLFERWGNFLIEPRYRPWHAVLITGALLIHLALHYATYIPALREVLRDLPYFRLHMLHEAEFLFIIVYSLLVFGLKGGLIGVGVTAVTSVPFLLTPYIFGRDPRPDEIRDLAIQVGFILLMGILMSVFYELRTRERERRLALAGLLEEANVLLTAKNEELEAANRQLTGLNQMIQKKLNQLYDEVHLNIQQEQRILDALPASPPNPLKERFSRFLRNVSSIIMDTNDDT